AVTAHRPGPSVGPLTSHGDDFPLEVIPSKIEVVTVPAVDTTLFEHRQEPSGRVSHVRSVAGPLTADDVPDDWRDASLSLLAPVVDEVDPMIATLFTDGAVGAAAQGWVRQGKPDGLVLPPARPAPVRPVPSRQALFLSPEGLPGP